MTKLRAIRSPIGELEISLASFTKKIHHATGTSRAKRLREEFDASLSNATLASSYVRTEAKSYLGTRSSDHRRTFIRAEYLSIASLPTDTVRSDHHRI